MPGQLVQGYLTYAIDDLECEVFEKILADPRFLDGSGYDDLCSGHGWRSPFVRQIFYSVLSQNQQVPRSGCFKAERIKSLIPKGAKSNPRGSRLTYMTPQYRLKLCPMNKNVIM